jgi:hypothetical protein
MARLTRISGLLAALAVAGALLVSAAEVSATMPGPALVAIEEANREAAERDVAAVLARFEAPPGAVDEPTFPPRVAQLLEQSETIPDSSRSVGAHHQWEVPGRPSQVLQRLTHGLGHGWESGGTSRYGSPEGSTRSVDLCWKREVEGIWSKELILTVTGVGRGKTALRVEAEDYWLKPRSANERVPAAAREMVVTLKREGRARSIATVNRRLIRSVARLINSQQVIQIYHWPSCGPPSLEPVTTYEVRFRHHRDGPTAALAGQSGEGGPCNPLTLRIDGKARVPLYGGFEMVDRVHRLVEQIYARARAEGGWKQRSV